MIKRTDAIGESDSYGNKWALDLIKTFLDDDIDDDYDWSKKVQLGAQQSVRSYIYSPDRFLPLENWTTFKVNFKN